MQRTLYNVKCNPANDPEVAAKNSIHLMEIDRRRKFRFSGWAPELSTPDTHLSEPEGTGTPILGKSSSELHTKSFNSVIRTYAKNKHFGILLQLLQQKYRSPGLEFQLEEPWLMDYKDNTFLSRMVYSITERNTLVPL
ncbi:hypothetical protein O181_094750 [Austropuccinia psidii MF-1]|uniref:Uncharacterized protein n=1 Tax=Austropuccinia psidii MF-1 TaxID=1389203 RepID=A0A9Q3PBD4_9BASI|nr:hypothetical protein [Austropuccinia psidii MF-1]